MLIAEQSYAQLDSIVVPIRTQTGDDLRARQFRFQYTIRVDGDSLEEIKLTQSSLTLPIPDSLIQLEIEGTMLQSYYNEFTVTDIQNLKEIEVYFSNRIFGETPRFFLDAIMNPSLEVSDSLNWFGKWLEDHDENEMLEGYSVHVYHYEDLESKQKKNVKKVHKQIDECLGIKSELVFTHEPYTTSDEDAFNFGTKITPEFIDSQNTNHMKELAENYSVVIMIIINWNEN